MGSGSYSVYKMNQFQSTQSGSAELKDYYGSESQYEAIKRRRKKAMEKQGIFEEPDYDYKRVEKPSPDYE